ncbi:glycosyltransferase family 2 protein [Hydrogenophaga sp.]|jgi:glycosyltransferase involved in cell wall biosynthesis|uniref:glycosyltransferase family 2 protein n=1 Tax=Hydrogenophaga sp. TaxID=1904254 RepID=UPI002607A827|nr:glycosyltransferase family 2 protein [Hydrogenophaga sp.]MDM7950135.1 glycosyltransferase family 2 protein [Hydrogenophaga sp.]
MCSCTIVIPTHNREDLLLRAVKSALAACPADGEVFVVDDKSIVAASQVLAHLQDARLTVLANTGPSGAANARNWGVSQAAGDVVFFLDDDDEMVKDYCQRILSPNGPASLADWGFSSTIERRGIWEAADRLRVRRRLRNGLPRAGSSPRDLVAALSDGLWIKRLLIQQMGGLDPEQAVDEDTDLCVRLLAASRCPWYEVDPGTIVYRGYMPSRAEGTPLTVATPELRALACYQRTHQKNAHRFGRFSRMRWFLVTRFVRKAVKAGEIGMATDLIGSLRPTLFRLCAWGFFCLKRMAHRGRPART